MWGVLLATVATVQAAKPDADALDAQVVELYRAGRYAEAMPLARQIVDIRRESPPDLDMAWSLTNLAGLLYSHGNYAAARPLYEESLNIRQEALGPKHPDVATSLTNLGAVLQALGDHAASRSMFERSLDILREAADLDGSGQRALAASLNNVAATLMFQGDYPASQRLYEESLAIRRKALGPRHPKVATSLTNLAQVLQDQGDYLAARRLFEEGLDIRREAFGSDGDRPRHPDVASSLSSLATLLHDEGDYLAARPLYEESLDILREALGPGHPRVAMTLNRLANLLNAQGDKSAARLLYEESLDIFREALGPRHRQVAMSLNNLGLLLKAQGDPAAARPLLEESLDIRREVLGPGTPDVAVTLHNLAMVLAAQGDYAAARPLYEESLDIWRETFGPRHPKVALGLGNLATMLSSQGDHTAARLLFEQSLDIVREAHGPKHPDVARYLNRLAGLLQAQGERDAARALRDEALGIIEERLTMLDGLSEREALRFLPTVRPTLDRWLTLFDRPQDAQAAWTHVLRFKGALAARARSARSLATIEPEVASMGADLDDLRRQLARFAFAESTPEERAERKDRIAELSEEKEGLERDLLAKSALYREASGASDATPADLCEALPDGSALIDLLRYTDGEPRYLAFVQRAGDCTVHRVELGPAAPIEQAARSWHEVLRDPNSQTRRIRDRGSALSELLYDPVTAVAGDSTHWLFVPDGPLATVPLGALPTADGYAIEERLITYLDRANAVLRSPKFTGEGALLVGGVDYDATRTEGDERSMLAPCNGGGFAPLPGAAVETEAVAARWNRVRRREPASLLGDASATESAVADAVRGKALVHIATHGFFATGRCKSALTDGAGYDPMLLSGLVLAGANQPADPFSPEDGIMTATEVATLDLSASNLVVLSACETGLGEIESGQGVLGLRRAIAIAGAHTLIMSLWSISDAETAALMDGLYSRHLRRRSMPAAEALRDAQLQILETQRSSGDDQPFAWAGFIASGDWR